MQVDDEDDIDIGGSEEVSIGPKSKIDDGEQNTIFKAAEDTNGNQDSAQYTVHIAPDYQESNWESHPSIDTSDMDEKSKALIQQMLAEEEYYFGAGTNSLERDEYMEPMPKKRKVQKRDPKLSDIGDSNYKLKSQDGQGKQSISSAELPSHKTRWSAEEDEKLNKALEKFGYGNWKAVAESVGTRNALQCKNHARHLVNSSKITSSPDLVTKSDVVKDTFNVESAPDLNEDADEKSFSSSQREDNPPLKNVLENGKEDSGDVDVHPNHRLSELEEPQDANMEDIEVDIDESIDTKQNTGNLLNNHEATVSIIMDVPGSNSTEEQPSSRQSPSEGRMKEENTSNAISINPMKGYKEEIVSEALQSLPSESQQSIVFTEENKVDKQETAVTQDSDKLDHVNEVEHQNDVAPNYKGMTLISDIPRKVEEDDEDTTEEVEEENLDQTFQSHDTNSDEKLFDPHNPNDDEIDNNREWFLGKPSKTPERYLKIRNTILAAWKRCKPRYLTKTSARNGLKDCGDVNAIGRVHTYLETIGAINTNCITNPPRPKRPAVSHVEYYSDEDEQGAGQVPDWLMEYEGPRKRKVRDERGQWVDPKDLEGRVIEHGVKVEEVKSRPKRTIRRPKHLDNDFRNGYDPFRLVPLEHYDKEPPFHVTIVSDALIVMDFHSYLAHTEIIGLLGGKFDADKRRLEVQCTFPCKSTSTGIQCEMDPESEMRAREVFAEKGMAVVGWYHSHPTFEPNPSVRDIENQSSYQSLFRHEETGLEPFIGVIVSPYDHAAETTKSKFQYLSISPGWDASGSFRMPYSCVTEIQQCDQPASDIYPQLQALVDEYCEYEHRVNMSEPFPKDGTSTRLDKLLDSLSSHLVPDSDASIGYLDKVRTLVVDKLPPPSPKGGGNGTSGTDNVAGNDTPTLEPTQAIPNHDPNSKSAA